MTARAARAEIARAGGGGPSSKPAGLSESRLTVSMRSTKKLTVCIVPSYQPYSWKDAEGKWQGFVAEMARNVSGALRVEPEFVETTFQTVVLDLQSAKCHAFFGFNATPERALAIDFSGPLYTLGFAFVNGKDWKPPGPGWAD